MERAPDPIDLSAHSFWQQPAADRDRAFAELRAERPVSWHEAPESLITPPEETTGGYWAVTKHADVRAVSRDPATFRSGEGVLFEDAPPELLEASQSFLAMDAPRHTKVRGLVNAAFTPRRVKGIEDSIRANAKRIVEELAERGDCDFVEHCAARLPMATIWSMMGLPESERERVTAAADDMVSWNDAEARGDREPAAMLFEAVVTVTGAALELADERRGEGADDLMTALVTTEIDTPEGTGGERLTDEEIGAFFVLLAVAGNDTTRHTTTHALRALTEHPDQRAWLAENVDERMPTAVEEFVRWASPVMTFRRTATRDAEVGGHPVAQGEKVVMFYASANRDEEAFERPGEFDLSRDPNHHVGFGGGGPHYCLGASLARTQLRAILTELLTTLPEIEAGEPDPLVGNFINGVRRMECRF